MGSNSGEQHRWSTSAESALIQVTRGPPKVNLRKFFPRILMRGALRWYCADMHARWRDGALVRHVIGKPHAPERLPPPHATSLYPRDQWSRKSSFRCGLTIELSGGERQFMPANSRWPPRSPSAGTTGYAASALRQQRDRFLTAPFLRWLIAHPTDWFEMDATGLLSGRQRRLCTRAERRDTGVFLRWGEILTSPWLVWRASRVGAWLSIRHGQGGQ